MKSLEARVRIKKEEGKEDCLVCEMYLSDRQPRGVGVGEDVDSLAFPWSITSCAQSVF